MKRGCWQTRRAFRRELGRYAVLNGRWQRPDGGYMLESDLGSPVALDDFDHAPFTFNGTIGTTEIAYLKKYPGSVVSHAGRSRERPASSQPTSRLSYR